MNTYPSKLGHVSLQVRFAHVRVDTIHPQCLARSPLAKTHLGGEREERGKREGGTEGERKKEEGILNFPTGRFVYVR